MIKFKGRLRTVDEFLQKIFNQPLKSKVRLNLVDMKKYVTEKYAADKDTFDEDFVKAFAALSSADELRSFVLNPSNQIKDVKDLLKVFLRTNKVDFSESDIDACKREHVVVLLDNAFDFGSSKASKVSQLSTASTTPTPTPPQSVKPIEITFETMRRIIDGCTLNPERFRAAPDDLDVTRFTLTEKMPVTLMNDFYMMVPSNLPLYHGVMAIITPERPHEIAAIGSLQFNRDRTHILLETRNIDYNIFGARESFYIVVFPSAAQNIFESGGDYEGEVYHIECTINFGRLESSQSTLCIDFGTSNTTVGTYGIKNPGGSKPEIVEFLDETGDTPEKRPMLPTVVYVDSCTGGSIKYSFGYEALQKVIDNDYNPTASVFYEIKRWINDMDSEEPITDEKGKTSKATHREIMSAYINHVLDLSERYFERHFDKLHFTAPVKLKDSFIEEMKNILGKTRTVLDASMSIDEGIAIIYNHISELMAENKLGNKPQKVLIMDCGGGTTDLASCRYSLSTGYVKRLNIRTKFENGDSNFGGNNITFRILQLLKIRLADRLKRQNNPDFGEECSIQNLIDDENILLAEIDASDEYDAYENFDAAYEEAEAWVPTKFQKENLQRRRGQLKRNFYYLWQMAEAYKVQFYRANMDFVSVDFNDADDRKIGIPDDDKYYLFVRESEDGGLVELRNPMSNIKITNNDIHRLLYADIYSLLKRVLYSYDVSDDEQELLKYNHYKLSGQSCKITLFNELLKEFIPGKYLRYGERKAASPDSSELKLACIKGSVYYMYDTEYGEIKPYMEMDTPNLIYDICKLDKNNNRLVMLDNRRVTIEETADEQKIKLEPTVDILSSDASRAKFAVLTQTGKEQNMITFDFNNKMGRPITVVELERDLKSRTYDGATDIGRYIADKLTDIDANREGDDVFALFTIPSKNGYGFYVYCIKKLKAPKNQLDRYHLQQPPKYYSFEDSKLDTFFDGNR